MYTRARPDNDKLCTLQLICASHPLNETEMLTQMNHLKRSVVLATADVKCTRAPAPREANFVAHSHELPRRFLPQLATIFVAQWRTKFLSLGNRIQKAFHLRATGPLLLLSSHGQQTYRQKRRCRCSTTHKSARTRDRAKSKEDQMHARRCPPARPHSQRDRQTCTPERDVELISFSLSRTQKTKKNTQN